MFGINNAFLATTSTLDIVLFAINLVVGILVAWLIYREKQRDQRLMNLESKLEKRAEELVDNKIERLVESIDEIKVRLDRGDREFKQQTQIDHKLELKFVNHIAQLNEGIQQRFATREDVAAVSSRVDRLQEKISEKQGGGQ